MASTEEKKLVRLLKRGDEKAFRKLVTKHSGYIYNIAYRIVGDKPTAEDLTQEVFITIFNNIASFREESSLSTWIYRIAYNHSLSYLKSMEKKGGKYRFSIEDVPETAFKKNSTVELSSPAEIAIGKETEKIIQQALCKLSPEHRMMLILRDIQGHSYEEIVKITQLEEGTVKSRLHRARLELTELVKPHLKTLKDV